MAETTINSPGLSATDTTTSTTGSESGRRAVNVLRAGREQAFDEAKTRVREAADQQRGRAAEAVGGMAGALHRAAGDMREENETMGRYADMAAERLDEVATYLRDADWGEVIHNAEDFARRQPYWFVGGAMAAGFLLARFVKNSGEAQRLSESSRMSQRLAASSEAGYGTSTEAGVYPPTTATTAPISSATSTPSGSPSSPYSGEV
jgi:ElaB/YqjD/DUF883 family membrane-anchored ribosome-binding protein